jgi:hypothetical protein
VGHCRSWRERRNGFPIHAGKAVKELKGSPLVPLGFVIFWYAFFCHFLQR